MGTVDVELPEPRVVCAACGRTRDRAAGPACDTPDWHVPQDHVPDAELDDDDAPATEEDLLAAIGPEPGKTWAELYAKAMLQLSYRTAELRGAQGELDRLRAGGRLHTGINDADSAKLVAALVRRLRGTTDTLRVPVAELEAGGLLHAYWTPATNELCLEVTDR